MPPGVPVATMAIGGAANAALFAARIVALTDSGVAVRLAAYVARMHDAAASSTPE
jgi:5-(carboxyamino)imidazole ribonucleotide mutase